MVIGHSHDIVTFDMVDYYGFLVSLISVSKLSVPIH